MTSENYTEPVIRDPELQSLITKVELAPDLAKEDGLELEVTLKNGSTYSQYMREATGELPNPLSWDALEAKFRFQQEYSQTVSPGAVVKIVEMLHRLEEMDSVKGVIKLACKT